MGKITNYLYNLIDLHMIISIITNVGLIMLFLGIFFFSYASTVEQEIVTINTNIITTDIISIISPILTDNAKSNIISKLEYPDMKEEDDKVVEINSQLVNTAYTYLISIFIGTLVLGYIMSYYSKNSFYEIMVLNIIILVFIALTEFTFLTLIPKSYISADTNYIKFNFLTKIKEKFIIPDA
jgi:ABC-type transport system involved in cytochrome bd biosynthesis fused ATPase/permease subunit